MGKYYDNRDVIKYTRFLYDLVNNMGFFRDDVFPLDDVSILDSDNGAIFYSSEIHPIVSKNSEPFIMAIKIIKSSEPTPTVNIDRYDITIYKLVPEFEYDDDVLSNDSAVISKLELAHYANEDPDFISADIYQKYMEVYNFNPFDDCKNGYGWLDYIQNILMIFSDIDIDLYISDINKSRTKFEFRKEINDYMTLVLSISRTKLSICTIISDDKTVEGRYENESSIYWTNESMFLGRKVEEWLIRYFNTYLKNNSTQDQEDMEG